MNSSLRFPRSRRWSFGARAVVDGFSLLEILLAIAIIGLLGAVLIGGSASLLAERPATPDAVFEQVVQECRKKALKSQQDVRLAFRKDGETRRFVILDSAAPPTDPGLVFTVPDPNAGVLAEFPIPNAADLEVSFLLAQKGGNMILVGGIAVETTTRPYVTFYADGTCTPFRAQFFRSGSTQIKAIDPWTCAAVLTPPDPNAPPP